MPTSKEILRRYSNNKMAPKPAGTALMIFIDELQYVKEPQMVALISRSIAAHKTSCPVTVVGAGLPQLRGRMGEVKSYAERLFHFPEIGPLSALMRQRLS